MTDKLAVRKVSDKALLECIKSLVAPEIDKKISASVNIFGGVSVSFLPSALEDHEELVSVMNEGGHSIATANINIDGLAIRYCRGGFTEPKSAYTDEFQIQKNSQATVSPTRILNIVSSLTDKFATLPNIENADFVRADQVAALHTATLERLEKLNEELIRETHEYRGKLEVQFAEKGAYEEEAYSQKVRSLEDDYQKKLTSLDTRALALDAEKEKLDSSSNTHARRQLRRDIIDAINERQKEFELTKGTITKRLPIFAAMGALLIVFGYLIYKSTPEFYDALESATLQGLIAVSVKQTLYVLGAVATVLYFIRWQNRWFEQHSSAEFELKQFQLDMERASWIVESSLEWKAEKGTEMPDSLVRTLSGGLFSQKSEPDEGLLHPSDQLASALLGTASAIKVKAGESEIQIDPKKLKKTPEIKNTESTS